MMLEVNRQQLANIWMKKGTKKGERKDLNMTTNESIFT